MCIVGWEVKGFVFKAKGRDQVVKDCHSVSWCYRFTTSGSFGEAGFWTKTGKTSYPEFAEAGHLSYWPTTLSCWGSQRGI